MTTGTTGYISLPGIPQLDGLAVRLFRGDEDWPGLADAFTRSRAASGLEDIMTAEKLAGYYADMKHFDPHKDLLVIELNGKISGYTRAEWFNELDGKRIYWHITFLAPELRSKVLEDALVNWAETRLREVGAGLPAPSGPRFLATDVFGDEPDIDRTLSSRGYEPVRYGYNMARPLDDLPEAPMPDGLEVRPVKPEHYRAIWKASEEAFQDHWGAEEPGDEDDFKRWLRSPWFQPDIWQVAWDGDQVAGMVLNFIDQDYNRVHNKKRGYTEDISVRRQWRRRGLARALIARSMKMFKDMGLTEVALGVDTENPNGARQLYEDMGFKVTGHSTSWRRPFEQ